MSNLPKETATTKLGLIAHGNPGLLSLANAAGLLGRETMGRVQACNMTADEIAERDRPVSRQERRKIEREARKGRLPKGDRP